MPSNYKNPPTFNGESYEEWKNELFIWQLMTDIDKKKQALAVTLSLNGNARKTALNCNKDELHQENGMDILISALDGLFLRETIDTAYEAYKNFDGFRKPEHMAISDYIIEFDQRYQKSTKYKMSLPDAELACKLLDNANLPNQQRQLVLTACASEELRYDKMKSAMKRIFGDVLNKQNAESQNANIVMTEQETALFTDQGKRHKPRRYFSKNSDRVVETNLPNKYGKRSRCRICLKQD